MFFSTESVHKHHLLKDLTFFVVPKVVFTDRFHCMLIGDLRLCLKALLRSNRQCGTARSAGSITNTDTLSTPSVSSH